MVGFDTVNPRVTSPTVAGPRLSRSTISRRSGWARALNASLAILLIVYGDDVRTTEERTMTEPRIGTQEEWQAERDELLKEEKELTRRNDELARKRRELPWVPVEKDYSFEAEAGT